MAKKKMTKEEDAQLRAEKKAKQVEKDNELKERFLEIYKEEANLEESRKVLGVRHCDVQRWGYADKEWLKRKKAICKEKRAQRIMEIVRTQDCGKKMIEARQLLKKKRQELFLAEFKAGNFHIGRACDRAGIPRNTYNEWRAKDDEFYERVLACMEKKKDDIEESLYKNIKDGDSQCIIFACKTKLRDRGYVEKQEIEHTGQFGVMVAPGRIEDVKEWATKAVMQQRLLKERAMEVEISGGRNGEE